jgi:hypothetical protein
LRLKPLLAAFIVATAVPAHAITFPIKDAKAAISIARKVCSNKASPTAKWHAELDISGTIWTATTPPKRPGWAVHIPVNGPYPAICYIHAYFVPSGTPREKGHKPAPAPGVVIPVPKPAALDQKRGA